MARKPSPWWWADEKGWYVNLAGKREFLGKHPEGAEPPRKSKRSGKWNAPKTIMNVFYKLMGRGEARGDADAIINILDDFITWCRENRANRTTDRYEEFCDDFVKFRPDGGRQIGELASGQLTSRHVTQWLADRPTWGSTTKRNAITALQRGFNWAVKNRGLARNPIKGMEKPQAKNRTEFVTPEEFEELLTAIPDQRLKDLLVVGYDSGARPFEVKELEARHCQLDKQRAVIPKEETKGRKHPRTFYFPTHRCMEVITRLCKENSEGKLFRNRLGRKWTAMAVKCRLEDLDHILGRRVTHYSLRHSFVTEKLVAGVDSHVVAKLAGHRDTKMIDTVYSHVSDDYEFMLKQASRRINRGKGSSDAATESPADV
jgi:integrase